MKVHIENSLYLESDERQFVIKDYTGKTNDDGKELYNTVAYITSLEHAFKYLVKMKVKQSTATDLKELIQDVKRIEEFVKDKLAV